MDSKQTVLLNNDGKDCFYVVKDFSLTNNVVSFTTNKRLHLYKFDITSLKFTDSALYVDCRNLVPIN